MNILVTGAGGYLGSLLVPELTRHGHAVTGLDTGFYRGACLYHAPDDQPPVRNLDIRSVTAADLRGYEAVVHMAELSNDPAGDLSPEATRRINHHGSVRLAQTARDAGVHRFIYMSSCSVYGVADGNQAVTEESPVNPQTAYALCKTLCERDIANLAGPGFGPVFLRNATAFGASPSQRFDLVVNNLCGLAWTMGGMTLTSDGSPWRPLVHALDIAKAIRMILEAPADLVHGQTLNIGSDAHNLRVRDIAATVATEFPGCRVSLGTNGTDNRSYRVSFAKLSAMLPEFRCEWDVAAGARQLKHLFETIRLAPEDFLARPYTRIRQLRHLLETGQIDKGFFWRAAA